MISRRVAVVLFSAFALLAATTPAAALSVAADPNVTAAQRAVSWLRTQQEADGGFELSDFAGFETPEAALVLAAAAQSGAWSGRRALHADQHTLSAQGQSPLDYLDTFASGTGDDAITGGVAAKLVALVLAPLCIDPRHFDPKANGAVDLLARIDEAARPNGAYGPEGVFSDTLYAVLAFAASQRAVPPATVALIRAAQEDDGGWNYLGSPDDQGFDDIDTTALAIQALLAAGVPASDDAIKNALGLLRGAQADDGSWSFFGNPDPNSTAVALLAFRAAGATPDHDGKGFLRSKQLDSGRIESPNDSFGVNTIATTQAVRALLGTALPVGVAPASCAGEGYALFAADGGVLTYGTAFHGSAGATPLNAPVVGGAVTETGVGYYLFARDGGVFAYGDAPFHGSAVGRDAAIVAGAVEPGGDGYRLYSASGVERLYRAGSDERITPGPTSLNAPIVAAAIAPTRDGLGPTDVEGATLFAGDGGVFTTRNAVYYGSLGATPLNEPVVAAALTPTGRGYYLFAADGGVFTFGDAVFRGSLGGRALNKPIVSAAVSSTGQGYVLFAADGGAFTFGDAVFEGSAGSLRLNAPIVGGAID
jgi:hypothetical protein